MSIDLPFFEARKIVRKLANDYNINGFVEWINLYKNGKIPQWRGCNKFLNKNSVKSV